MAEVARFRGIIIHIYTKDHPPPHIHVIYAGLRAKLDFNGSLIAGKLPVNILRILKTT